MTPILGIMASAISGNLWAPGKDYDSIATTTLGSSTASVTFSSIPSTYRYLQIRASVQPVSGDDLKLQFNSDTTAANYYTHYLNGGGASAGASGASTYYTGIGLGYNAAGLANVFGGHIIDILDYANTSKYKTTRTLCGSDYNGSGQVALLSGLWSSTAAITSIVISNRGGANLTQYSSFALYGIK